MNKTALVVTAVDAEKAAIERGLSQVQGQQREGCGFKIIAAGVGPACAAAATAAELAASRYDIVISAGIAGGFPGQAPIGSVAIADTIIAADLGIETAEGFRSLEEMSLGYSRIQASVERTSGLVQRLRSAGLTVATGPILTVSTATGTTATASAHRALVPNALAEAMEGFGAAVAAGQFRLPIIEVRTISNAVGPRDRSAWRIEEALASLERVGAYLSEVLK